MTVFNKMIHFIEKTRRWLQKGERKDIFFWGVIVLSMALIGESIWIGDYLSHLRYSGRGLLTPTSIPAFVVMGQGDTSVKPGEKNIMKIILKSNEAENIRGLDIVLAFDPEKVVLVDADPTQAGTQVEVKNEALGQVARNLVDEQTGRIFISWLNFGQVGTAVMPGDEITLAAVHFRPLKTKGVEFRFLSGTKVVDTDGQTVTLQTKDFLVKKER